MNLPPIALAASLLLSLGASLVQADEPLHTNVSLLIGYTDKEAETNGVLVVPGTVIPIDARAHRGRNPSRSLTAEEAAAKLKDTAVKLKDGTRTARDAPSIGPSERQDRLRAAALGALESARQRSAIVGVVDSLKRTLRLSEVETRYQLPLRLDVGVENDLPAPSESSPVSLSVKLLGFNDSSATYEVRFFERSAPIAETPITVVRGQRAVVGGLNGDEAPYLFLVVEPAERSPNPNLAEAEPIFVRGDVVPPIKRWAEGPRYPEEARKARIQGVAIVQAVINTDGTVGSVKVLKGLPMGLSEAAVEAVSQWQFEPARLDGEPVAVYFNITINFRLAKEQTPAEPEA